MKIKWFLCIFLVFLLIMLLFWGIDLYVKNCSRAVPIDVFVGVDVAYDGVEDIKKFIDEVKSYTNFFVIGSTGITYNVTKLNEVCQYVYDSGLYFTTYTHSKPDLPFSQAQWISDARQRWGNRFLGLYAYDEPGGNQIDKTQFMLVREANSFTNAAGTYVENLIGYLSEFRNDWGVGDFHMLTSDYALYEFDYRAGYDAILAEFGWNHSRLINVALCRGAAAVRNKEWGVMITWTYTDSPYIESKQMYEDLIMAYQNGAKYILVFNYPKNNSTYGILQEKHLEALRRFWQYIKDNPRTTDTIDDRVAYVLPKDYGYGFRGPNDTIWGLWEADNLSNKIWNDVNTLMESYKPRLDIIYEDNLQCSAYDYGKLVFWNGTIFDRQ